MVGFFLHPTQHFIFYVLHVKVGKHWLKCRPLETPSLWIDCIFSNVKGVCWVQIFRSTRNFSGNRGGCCRVPYPWAASMIISIISATRTFVKSLEASSQTTVWFSKSFEILFWSGSSSLDCIARSVFKQGWVTVLRYLATWHDVLIIGLTQGLRWLLWNFGRP